MSIRPIYTYTPIGRPQDGDRRSFGVFLGRRLISAKLDDAVDAYWG